MSVLVILLSAGAGVQMAHGRPGGWWLVAALVACGAAVVVDLWSD